MKQRGYMPWRTVYAWVLLLLTVGLVMNHVLFLHLALGPHGTWIQHAHPFDYFAWATKPWEQPQSERPTEESPIKGHQHTTGEWIILSSLAQWYGVEMWVGLFLIHSVPLLHISFIELPISLLPTQPMGRSPPMHRLHKKGGCMAVCKVIV